MKGCKRTTSGQSFESIAADRGLFLTAQQTYEAGRRPWQVQGDYDNYEGTCMRVVVLAACLALGPG